jgi:hypothetical protein
MDKPKVEPVILPDVHDPSVPLADLLPPTPPAAPPTKVHQPEKGQGQPQTSKQPLDGERDRDIGGG